MNESLLHFIWKYRLFNQPYLYTTDHQKVEIDHPGYHNFNAGPDFKNARIKIDDTLWAGNVEIHIKTSDWKHHGHDQDIAYKNVVLHVTYHDDFKNQTDNKVPNIPTLELQPFLPPKLLDQYEKLMENKLWIPCADQIHKVDEFHINQWLNRVLVERLEQKCQTVDRLLQENQNNWRSTLYQLLARNFGFNVNQEAFEKLASIAPLKMILKHKNNLQQIEALLLGQAGFLQTIFTDAYPNQLQQEYDFLAKKYGLQPMGKHEWNFLRLRPNNFPSIRIAQFAKLLHNASHLFSKVVENEEIKPLKALFKVDASEYWDTHYQLDKRSSSKSRKAMGQKGIENILINSIVPFLFHYGNLKGKQNLKDRAFSFLEHIKPEKNHILKKWESLGLKNNSAYHSQALIYLKKAYCDKQKCLKCGIGTKLLMDQF